MVEADPDVIVQVMLDGLYEAASAGNAEEFRQKWAAVHPQAQEELYSGGAHPEMKGFVDKFVHGKQTDMEMLQSIVAKFVANDDKVRALEPEEFLSEEELDWMVEHKEEIAAELGK